MLRTQSSKWSQKSFARKVFCFSKLEHFVRTLKWPHLSLLRSEGTFCDDRYLPRLDLPNRWTLYIIKCYRSFGYRLLTTVSENCEPHIMWKSCSVNDVNSSWKSVDWLLQLSLQWGPKETMNKDITFERSCQTTSIRKLRFTFELSFWQQKIANVILQSFKDLSFQWVHKTKTHQICNFD